MLKAGVELTAEIEPENQLDAPSGTLYFKEHYSSENLYDNYAYVYQKDSFVTFSFRLFTELHQQDTVPNDIFQFIAEKFGKIANYSLSRISSDLAKSIKKEELKVSEYSFILKEVNSYFASPFMEVEEISMEGMEGITALFVDIVFDTVDEPSLKPGGKEYQKAKARYEEREKKHRK